MMKHPREKILLRKTDRDALFPQARHFTGEHLVMLLVYDACNSLALVRCATDELHEDVTDFHDFQHYTMLVYHEQPT